MSEKVLVPELMRDTWPQYVCEVPGPWVNGGFMASLCNMSEKFLVPELMGDTGPQYVLWTLTITTDCGKWQLTMTMTKLTDKGPIRNIVYIIIINFCCSLYSKLPGKN